MRAEDFFALKNPTASDGFEPANLGTKGQHATPRPPKPLAEVLIQLKIPVIPPGIEPVDSRVLKRILGPMRGEVVGGCKNCTMRKFIICDIHHLRLR